MFFDYFLSIFWNQYDHRTLYEFSQFVYKILEEHKEILPKTFLPTFTDMKRQNWLICYGTIEGMGSALTEISKRATFDSKMETAHMVLEKKEETFKNCFDDFFPDLVAFSKMRVMALQSGL
jgi:acyl carrier protein phosphodiesterase